MNSGIIVGKITWKKVSFLCLTKQYRHRKTSEHTKMSIFGLSNAKLRSVLAKYGYLGEECQRTYEFHSMTELNPFQGKKIRS